MSIGKRIQGQIKPQWVISLIKWQENQEENHSHAFTTEQTLLLFPLTALCETQPHTNMVTFKSFHVYQLPSGLTVGLQVRLSLFISHTCIHTYIQTKQRFLTEVHCRWIKLHGSLLFLSRGHGSSSVHRPKQTHIHHCYVVVIFRVQFDIGMCSLCLTLERTGLSFS